MRGFPFSRPWDSQPQEAADLIADPRLLYFGIGSPGLSRNLASSEILTGSAGNGVGEYGLYQAFNGSQDLSKSIVSSGYPLTIIAKVRTTLTSGVLTIASVGNSAGNVGYSRLILYQNKVQAQIGQTSSAANLVAAGTYSPNKWFIAAATFSSSEIGASLDGQALLTRSSTISPTGIDTLGIGRNYGNNVAERFTGDIEWLAVFAESLSAQEITDKARELSNYWMFAPRTTYIPVAAAVGGRSAITSLSAAIQAARANTASISAAIQQARSNTASADAAIQLARTVQSSLDAALQQARTSTASVTAAIEAARSASASVDAYVQAGFTATASLSAAVQFAGTPVSTSLDAVVQRALAATASLQAVIQAEQTASASINAYIQAGTTASASLSAAIQAAQSASVSISAAVAVARSASASLGAAIALQMSINAAVNAVIAASRSAVVGLGAYVFDNNSYVSGPSGGGYTPRPALGVRTPTAHQGRPSATQNKRNR